MGFKEIIQRILSATPFDKMLSASVIKSSPIFWSYDQIIHFINDVSNLLDQKYKISENSLECSEAIFRVESICESIFNLKTGWNTVLLNNRLGKILIDKELSKTYNFHSLKDLLRAIRNKYQHYYNLNYTIQGLFENYCDGDCRNKDFYYTKFWMDQFPTLIYELWKIFMTMPKDDKQLTKMVDMPKNLKQHYSKDVTSLEEEEDRDEMPVALRNTIVAKPARTNNSQSTSSNFKDMEDSIPLGSPRPRSYAFATRSQKKKSSKNY